MYVENLLFSPIRLLERAKNIQGIYWLTDISSINEQYNLAQEIAEEWTDDWGEDDGFGSSDFTFALKDFKKYECKKQISRQKNGRSRKHDSFYNNA